MAEEATNCCHGASGDPGRDARGDRELLAPRGLPGRLDAAAHGPVGRDGRAHRMPHVPVEPLRRAQDRLGARRRDHRGHHLVRPLRGAGARGPAALRAADVDPREQRDGVHRLVGGLLDRRDDGVGHRRLPAGHRPSHPVAGAPALDVPAVGDGRVLRHPDEAPDDQRRAAQVPDGHGRRRHAALAVRDRSGGGRQGARARARGAARGGGRVAPRRHGGPEAPRPPRGLRRPRARDGRAAG